MVKFEWSTKELMDDLRERLAEDGHEPSEDDAYDFEDFLSDRLMDKYLEAIDEFVDENWMRWEDGEEE